MPAINYADKFERDIAQKYTRELTSSALGTTPVRFADARTVKIPRMTLAGYKEHGRSGGWNRQAFSNDYESKTLTHDRDVEFYVDAMDVDESNQVVSAANITNTFLTEHSIPEIDKFRYSKLYAEYTGKGGTVDTTALTEESVLRVFDKLTLQMDEAEVPEEGRMLYITPTAHDALKRAKEIQRSMGVAAGGIDRRVRSLDDITFVKVPSSRMLSAYNFTDGVTPGVGAKQINMILCHPSAVISPIKHTAIYLFAPGQHTGGDGYLYQNRLYMDLFLIERKLPGVQINATA